MTRRVQRQFRLRIQRVGRPKRQHNLLALARHPRRHQPPRPFGHHNAPMLRQMIEMRVRHKRKLRRLVRIAPQIHLRQINTPPRISTSQGIFPM